MELIFVKDITANQMDEIKGIAAAWNDADYEKDVEINGTEYYIVKDVFFGHVVYMNNEEVAQF